MTEDYKDGTIDTAAILNPDGTTWTGRLSIKARGKFYPPVSIPGVYPTEQAALDAALASGKTGMDEIDEGTGSFILVGVPTKQGVEGSGTKLTTIDLPPTSAAPIIYKESTIDAKASQAFEHGPWTATVTVSTLHHPVPQSYPLPGTFASGDEAIATAQALGRSIVDELDPGAPPVEPTQLVSKTTYPYSSERIYIESDTLADGSGWTSKFTIYTLTAQHDYNVGGQFQSSQEALEAALSSGQSLVDKDKSLGAA